ELVSFGATQNAGLLTGEKMRPRPVSDQAKYVRLLDILSGYGMDDERLQEALTKRCDDGRRTRDRELAAGAHTAEPAREPGDRCGADAQVIGDALPLAPRALPLRSAEKQEPVD